MPLLLFKDLSFHPASCGVVFHDLTASKRQVGRMPAKVARARALPRSLEALPSTQSARLRKDGRDVPALAGSRAVDDRMPP
jgi:hypothetical protein